MWGKRNIDTDFSVMLFPNGMLHRNEESNDSSTVMSAKEQRLEDARWHGEFDSRFHYPTRLIEYRFHPKLRRAYLAAFREARKKVVERWSHDFFV